MEDVFIPRNAKGNYDWNAIADGRYYVEWYVGGTRRRVSAGVTAAQALEVQRRKHHELEKAANRVSPGLKQPAKRSRNLHCTSPSRNTWSRSQR
jgi:hypothetical protein